MIKCNRPDIVVACILDPFSYECFRYECQLTQLDSVKWRSTIKKIKPDFLLVESAWRGLDHSWENLIGGKSRKVYKTIGNLVRYCKNNNIPTVFWNKEDPPHFTHFLETAKLFDFIFTSDVQCVGRYKKLTGNNHVYALPFAAQPVIHNPVGASYGKKRNVAFAGTYYNQSYPERRKDLPVLFDPALKYDLHIYDRHYGSGDKAYTFPKPYQNHIVGGLNYLDMVQAYKQYKVFLNMNSVKDSPTMFARRVFELLASGTNVISTYNKGMATMFPHIIKVAYTQEDTSKHLVNLLHNQDVSERLSLLGIREVYSRHLYKHRFSAILRKLGIPESEEPGVTIVTYVQNAVMMRRVLDHYRHQAWGKKELILLTNQVQLFKVLSEKLKLDTNVSVYPIKQNLPIGQSIAFAISRARYDYISFFNEAHYYAPHFITDLMHAFQYTEAQIIGKRSYYTYAEQGGNLFLQSEDAQNMYVKRVCDSAWIINKDVFAQVPFPDQLGRLFNLFQDQCRQAGIRLYSTDKYNYTDIRAKDSDKVGTQHKTDLGTLVAKTDDYKKYVVV
ncbi:MAG: hypothetical protein K0Q81_242 [Paenibacillus sp.]|nr:hypothetical protein [Paenibacillus sp.]